MKRLFAVILRWSLKAGKAASEQAAPVLNYAELLEALNYSKLCIYGPILHMLGLTST